MNIYKIRSIQATMDFPNTKYNSFLKHFFSNDNYVSINIIFKIYKNLTRGT